MFVIKACSPLLQSEEGQDCRKEQRLRIMSVEPACLLFAAQWIGVSNRPQHLFFLLKNRIVIPLFLYSQLVLNGQTITWPCASLVKTGSKIVFGGIKCTAAPKSSSKLCFFPPGHISPAYAS